MNKKEQIEKLELQIEWLEDKQGFAPRELKNRLWALRAEVENEK